MKRKIITAIGAGSFIIAMVALSGCYDSSYPDYGYRGYGYGPGYYSQPVVVGGYDENRSWWGGHRDRDEDREEWREHREHEEHERHEHHGHDDD